MTRKIIFDHTNCHWVDDRDYNHLFIRVRGKHINAILKVRGYIYLNDIYEDFGVKWNPECENTCILYKCDDKNSIVFDIDEVCENTFEITITF